jgi:hypothetical protein
MTEVNQLTQPLPQLFEVYMPVDERKPRLARRFSWPVGVERLSERFASVPQASHFRVWFGDHPFDSTSAKPRLTMEHIANHHLAYPILSIWYYVRGGNTDWFIMLYPVEAAKKRQVRALLEESVFPGVESWLLEERTPSWLATSHRLECIYDPDGETINISTTKG